MNSKDLEELIDRELKGLPLPEAPSTLLPRVLAAIESPLQSPWYRQTWSHWPPVLRLLSAGMVGVVLIVLTFLEPLFQGALRDILSVVVQPVMNLTGDLRAAFGAVESLRRVLIEPLLGYLVVLGIMMGTTCAGLGAALTRMASLGGEST